MNNFIKIISIIGLLAVSHFAYADSKSKASAESFMTCASGNGDGIKAISVPAAISIAQCPLFKTAPFSCADCIISLENQGCKLVKVVVTHLMIPTLDIVSGTTYLLSCVKP